jgi:hypothetical protein
MKKSKIVIPALALGTIAIAGVGMISSVSAYQGDYSKQGPNFSEERHAIMTQAFENNDYATWRAEMEKNSRRGRVLDVVNQDNFARFAEAHRLGVNGQTEEADAIRAELGLRGSKGERMNKGYGNKQGQGNGQGRGEHRGQNQGGNFVDANGDGTCDNLN